MASDQWDAGLLIRLIAGAACLALGLAAVFQLPGPGLSRDIPLVTALFFLIPTGTVVLFHSLSRPLLGNAGALLVGVGMYLAPGAYMPATFHLAPPGLAASLGPREAIMMVILPVLFWPWQIWVLLHGH